MVSLRTDVGMGRFEPWPASDVHLEWGFTGAGLAAERGDVVVIVDILSFSTTLTVALERGITPLVMSPEEIEARGGYEATEAWLGAKVISKTRRVTDGGCSLSPASVLRAVGLDHVVFTSLNGARAVASSAGATATVVLSLRNRAACARVVARLRKETGRRVTVVPCGEHWSSTSDRDGFRPSLEDWWAAGALATRLAEHGLSLSPEADVAAEAVASTAPRHRGLIHECVSGRELVAKGFAEDVEISAELDVSDAVPVRAPATTPPMFVAAPA